MDSTTNAAWLGNTIFDGARAFDGVTPDLDLHCARAVRSAQGLAMAPTIAPETIFDLVLEGINKFPKGQHLYIRPMFWIQTGFIHLDAASTQFALVIERMQMPDPQSGFSACLSTYRRPGPEQAPTHAKATCLYPLATMAVAEANQKGFDNAVMCDALGFVAEFTLQNLFMVKDGEVHTPSINGAFLNGITRQRVISLLQTAKIPVHERPIRPAELLGADEIFSSGNHARVFPCSRYEGRDLGLGPVYQKVRDLYWDFAFSGKAVPLSP